MTNASHVEIYFFSTTLSSQAEADFFTMTHSRHADTSVFNHDSFQTCSGVDNTCVSICRLDVRAVNSPLHLNVDWMCSKIRGLFELCRRP
jgi:hypothetical protein